MYWHIKILYQRHMLNNGPNTHKTEVLAEVLNCRRSSGGASDNKTDNKAAVSGNTPATVKTQPTPNWHTMTMTHRALVLLSCT
jgi:hypothetical protein